MLRSFLILFISLIVFASCGSPSLEESREEAQGVTRSLVKELQAIHSRAEVIERLPKLKKLFNRLVDVLITAHELKNKQKVDAPLLANEDLLLSDSLRGELSRVYGIEGARNLIEKAQQDALYRLDAFLKKNALYCSSLET